MSDFLTSEELIHDEIDLEKLIGSELFQGVFSRKAEHAEAPGLPEQLATAPDDPAEIKAAEGMTYDKRGYLALDDLESLRVCRTYEVKFGDTKPSRIEARADDIDHLLKSMSNYEADLKSRGQNANKVTALLERFSKHKSLSTISKGFAEDAVRRYCEKNGYDYSILSNPSYIKKTPIKDFQPGDPRSKTFNLLNSAPNYYEALIGSAVIQINHRITQEAIEKNRFSFANGIELVPENRQGFTYDKFEKIADGAIGIAMQRIALQSMTLHAIQKAREESKKLVSRHQLQKEQREVIKLGLEENGIVKSFGKRFVIRKGEGIQSALKRISKDFREHAAKKLEEFESKGLDVILAQGIAKAHKDEKVGRAHLEKARQLIEQAKRNPIKYSGLEKIFRQAVGPENKNLVNEMQGKLRADSAFQRSYNAYRKIGEHLNANREGRTRRIQKFDGEKGRLFAANVLRDSRRITQNLSESIRDNGYSVSSALKAQKSLKRSIGKTFTKHGKALSLDDFDKIVSRRIEHVAQQARAGDDGLSEQRRKAQEAKKDVAPSSTKKKRKNDDPERGGPTR